MFLARVVCQYKSYLRVSTCVGHLNHSTRSLDPDSLPPKHVSSATRKSKVQKPVFTRHAVQGRSQTFRGPTLSKNIGRLLKENPDRFWDADESEHELDHKTEHGESQPRYIARSPTLSNLESTLMSYDGFAYSDGQWRDFEAAVCAENADLKTSWPALCIGLMLQYGCLPLATSLIDFLTQENGSANITTLCMYINLLGMHGGENKEQEIGDAYQKVREISDVFDSRLAKHLIIGLSATSRWRETLDILEMAQLTGSVGPSYYSPIIQAAMGNGDTELGFKLLNELISKGFQPQDRVVKGILRVCQVTGSNDLLERYFMQYVWQSNWCLSQHLAADVEHHFTMSEQEKWTCKWTNVDTVRGDCFSCKHSLQRIAISSSDFEALQREFLQKTLVGDNIYLKSNPQEMETFCDFVQENAPFDVVLDALNISCVNKKMSKTRQLREMVHFFARERRMRVLVLGRAHMLKWNAADMDYIQRYAKTFFTDNMSADDPFCLYATLYSGKDCMFVSRDFMRNHKFNLGLRFKDVFERWQRSHQILNFWVDHRHVSVQMPSQYDYGPVKDEKGWHIPYDDGNLCLRARAQPVLCLRYKGQQTQKVKNRNDEIST